MSALPPITDVAVKRPLLPIFLRQKRQHKSGSALAQSARMISRWHQDLRVSAELKLRLLVVKEAPLYANQCIASASLRAVAIFIHDLNWKFQLQLDIGQSVIEIEQRRVHLRYAWCVLQNERNIDLPSARWRRLWVVGDERRASEGQINCQQPAGANQAAKFHQFAGGPDSARHYLCVTLRMRPSAGSIRYAVSPLPATTPRAPLTVGTNAFRRNFPSSPTSIILNVAVTEAAA